jgi:hypothetical protein
MTRSRWRPVGVIVFTLILGLVVRNQIKVHLNRKAGREAAAKAAARAKELPRLLFDALRPVALAKCRLERFGEANDGGYALCANLLAGAQAGYSYGINGYDKWGCDVSTRLKVPVHQYDCFNTEVPRCRRGTTFFHSECVGASLQMDDGRLFDSIDAQLTRNGDTGRHVVMKMDVEGAEWESLAAAPDAVLERIDQLAIEMHGVTEELFLTVVQRLKRFFHVAHVHFNNFACKPGLEPFPAWAYEVLLVSRRLDEEDPSRTAGGLLPIDARNNLEVADCPAATTNPGR